MIENTNITETAVERVVQSGKPLKSQRVERTLDAMKPNLDHGASWPLSFFEEHLDLKFGTVSFGIAIANLTERLEMSGYHLTSKGKNAQSWWVEDVKNTRRIARSMNKSAMRQMLRAARLSFSTSKLHASKLPTTEVMRLEKDAETYAKRFLFMQAR
jgi:hypothetical protein